MQEPPQDRRFMQEPPQERNSIGYAQTRHTTHLLKLPLLLLLHMATSANVLFFSELRKLMCGRYLRAAKLNPAARQCSKGRHESTLRNQLSFAARRYRPHISIVKFSEEQ